MIEARFYKPAFYKEAPTKELSEEEEIYSMNGRSDMVGTVAPEYIAGTSQTVYAQVLRNLNIIFGSTTCLLNAMYLRG